ncbi:MAG: hypothetical protein E6J75_05700 [Deltaproteobacteria bacterium]|nr:MAG: hypothetical protein E6J75_05700 [Deltaproteobacteria bacterium]
MAIAIERPEGTEALAEFVLFQDAVYADRSARWAALPALQVPLVAGLTPFTEGRTIHPLLARDGDRILARAVAVLDGRYNRHWNERLGHLLMFEARPGTRQATRLLVDAACEWLRERGAEAARAGFGMLEFPFVVDDYDSLPPSILRHNPAYYHALLKDAGFETEHGMVDYKIQVRPELVARWESALEAVRRAGYEIVPLAGIPEARRAAEFTELWNDGFKAHWGYTPPACGRAVGGSGDDGSRARRARAHDRRCREAQLPRDRRPGVGPRPGREPGDVGVRVSGAGAARRAVRELHPRPRRQLAVAPDGREARRRGVRQLPRVPAELPALSDPMADIA